MQMLIGISILINLVSLGGLFCSLIEPSIAETFASMLYSRAMAVRLGRQVYRESRKKTLKLEDPMGPVDMV